MDNRHEHEGRHWLRSLRDRLEAIGVDAEMRTLEKRSFQDLEDAEQWAWEETLERLGHVVREKAVKPGWLF